MKKCVKLLSVFMVAFLLCGCAGSAQFNEAKSLQEEGKYAEAIKVYEQIENDAKAEEAIKLCQYAIDVEAKNEELDEAIKHASAAVENPNEAMNEDLRTNLQDLVIKAEGKRVNVDPKHLDKNVLNGVDYSDIIAELNKETNKLNQSISIKNMGNSIKDTANDVWDVIDGKNKVNEATDYVKDIFGIGK